MKHPDVYLDLIRDSAEKISRALTGVDEEAFVHSETLTAAVILWLSQIGELAKRLPEEIKSRYDLPWKAIIGFRDFAVHEYHSLNLHDVWVTATEDILVLTKELSE
jgi:uncharacterized protein with HEPN domain